MSAFQLKSTERVLGGLGTTDAAGVVVTAGTGSGKTLAFYMPMLAWICDQGEQATGVLALALYPRNELLKDQLRALVSYALRLNGVGGQVAPISLATWFGATPPSAKLVRDGKSGSWQRTASGYICPFMQCPDGDCDSELIWPHSDLRNATELLRCTKCGTEIPGSVLRLTRESARTSPARIMLSTTESLNRQLSSPGNLRAFGVVSNGLRAVLLDEVHTYEGTTGAQNAYLLRRLRKALGYEPLWAGLSATLTDAGEFFARFVDLDAGRVTVVEPDPSDLEESGAEYLVALRHNPHGNTGTLSTTIQTAMVLSRSLDPMNGNVFNPPVDSGGIFGSRLFAFTDKLDSTNRLYWDLLDAEGWAWPGSPKRGVNPLTLAHLRSREQCRLPAAQREDPLLRDAEGQYWWLAEDLGHELDGDVQERIGRTSSQDTGVAADADIVVATASLEVGFDDDRVGAVLQHKAPHDAAQFLQRKGRAGRNPATRPWTVVVLTDWGRDREAWDAYDVLFSPVVPPRSLPLDNLYVVRIQAVYSLLDWLARELSYGTETTWGDAAGPADLLSKHPEWVAKYEARQAKIAEILTALLRDGAERASLVRHLRKSLSLGSGLASDVTIDKLLWEAPRPLLGAVVPTLRRRLRDQWKGERPANDDAGVRTRTPLRDFVPGNLFDELLVPDVEFQIPWARNETHVEHLPALQAIQEFLPGSVSRRFGVWATNKRHWIPLPDTVDIDGAHLVDVSAFRGVPIDDVVTEDGIARVFVPTLVALQSVPVEVGDASAMRADWVFNAAPLGAGTRLPTAGAVSSMFEELTAHLHSQGGGVRIVRFACAARGVLWSNGQSNSKRVRFQVRNGEVCEQAALGVEIYADALQGRVALPPLYGDPRPSERREWLRELIYDDRGFPQDLSIFDRRGLADCTEVFAALWDWDTGDPDSRQFTNGITRAATLLDLHDPAHPNTLSAWIGDNDVLASLRLHLLSARASERSPEWLESLNRRLTMSAAEALLAALGHVDADDLVIDLDPHVPGEFYIAEQSPGGTGQIEALAVDLIETPERLPMAIADVLRPNDMELLDDQLRSVISSGDAGVRAAIAGLAGSWTSGHHAVADATADLDTALEAAGLVVDHAAKTALSTRLAGPGALPDFCQEVQQWLFVRDTAERSCGLEVVPSTLAALLAERTDADTYLHLGAPTAQKRSRAIANVLWPWGQSARSSGFFNPYVDRVDRSIELLRQHWRAPIEIFEFTDWDDDRRSEVHDLLRGSGEVLMRVSVEAKRILRTALVDVQTIPVEVGPLWCFPEVLGVHDRGVFVNARLVLRETW
ncbi:hypothetical protein BST16_09190 [Mycobacterium asiaticum DSM 44297]|nr:hypothetical protein BST16_09190 [Mycobacterium asiaticum DSM 44297]